MKQLSEIIIEGIFDQSDMDDVITTESILDHLRHMKWNIPQTCKCVYKNGTLTISGITGSPQKYGVFVAMHGNVSFSNLGIKNIVCKDIDVYIYDGNYQGISIDCTNATNCRLDGSNPTHSMISEVTIIAQLIQIQILKFLNVNLICDSVGCCFDIGKMSKTKWTCTAKNLLTYRLGKKPGGLTAFAPHLLEKYGFMTDGKPIKQKDKENNIQKYLDLEDLNIFDEFKIPKKVFQNLDCIYVGWQLGPCSYHVDRTVCFWKGNAYTKHASPNAVINFADGWRGQYGEINFGIF